MPADSLEISDDDLVSIRHAVSLWKGAGIATAFHGVRVASCVTNWVAFVSTEWVDYDISEYDHDIGCRYWLELVATHSSPQTRERLLAVVGPVDAIFHARMASCRHPKTVPFPGRATAPYFWETHTIHPLLAAD